MELRKRPYLPLYVQDYLTDERLNQCTAATQGIYIKILCIFHKQETYGGILLKQKDKQNKSTNLNFAKKLAKLLTFELEEIHAAIDELIEEEVLKIDGDFMYQKRMVKDNELSITRALAGSKGGKKTQLNNKDFALAKVKANTEYENEYENEYEIRKKKGGLEEKGKINFDDVYNTQWMEGISRNNQIDFDELLNHWETFKRTMEDRDDLYRTPDEYRKHFPSWVKKQSDTQSTGLMKPKYHLLNDE